MQHDLHESGMDLSHYSKKSSSSPPPFLLKTYMLVDESSTNDVISWTADGAAFVVWHVDRFSRDLLPTLFKHSNFSSFVRQLNTYGFRKVATTRWEFYNEMFRRGAKHLLCNIRRRKAWERKLLLNNPLPNASKEVDNDQGFSSTSSSSSSSSSSSLRLLDENKKLRLENEVLTSELTNMKNKCSELLCMMAHDETPKLFGVRLDVLAEKKKDRSTEINERIQILLSK